MEQKGALDFLIDLIQKSGNPTTFVTSCLVLIYYIVDKIISAFGSPELRVIDKHYSDLNENLKTLIQKLGK